MEIWHGIEQVPADLEASVVTIGVFDGIHRGHRSLISAAREKATEHGLPCVLMTFDPHPLAVVKPDRMPPMLGSVAGRADLAEELGVDYMFAVRFTTDLAEQSPEEFFNSVLRGVLKAQAIIVGENFTFGHRAAGTTTTMKQLGDKHGVEVDVVPLLTEDGVTLSSSVIRDLLGKGDVARAAWALGRPYCVTGEVVRGAGRGGSELGYPTANMYFPETVALPADGVYSGWFTVLGNEPLTGDMVPGERYMAAISIGTNPTFGDEERSVETFVLDKTADLYGRVCAVEFVERVRFMEKFDSVDELLSAICTDVEKTREILNSCPSQD